MEKNSLIPHFFTLTIALFATMLIAQTQSVPFAGYGPAGIGDKDSTNGDPKMVLWLSADTGVVTNQDNEVTRWYDISGWGDSATNEFAGTKPPNYSKKIPQGPTYKENGFGGLPTIHFGNQDTSGALVINDHDRLDGADGIAMFTILKRNVMTDDYRLIFEKRFEGGDDNPNRAYVFEFDGGAQASEFHGNINRDINLYNDTAIKDTTVPFILGTNYSKSRLPESLIFMYTNGTYSPQGTPQYYNYSKDIHNSPAPAVLARTGRLDISEIITFRGGLTLTESYAVSAYLGAKYGVMLMDKNRRFFDNSTWKKDMLHLGVVKAERVRGNPSARTRGLTLVGDSAVMDVSTNNPASSDQHVFVAHKGDALAKEGEYNRAYYVTNKNGFSFDMYFDFEDAGLAINTDDTAQATGYKLYFADARNSIPVFDSIIDGSATKVDSTLKFEVNNPLKGWLKISKTAPSDTVGDVGLSVKEVQSSSVEGLQLYPNPAKEQVKIRLSQAGEGRATINIFNLTGQKVMEEQYQNGVQDLETQVNINSLNPGWYLVEVIINNQRIVDKIMVK